MKKSIVFGRGMRKEKLIRKDPVKRVPKKNEINLSLNTIPKKIEELIAIYIKNRTGHEISQSDFLEKLRQTVLAQKAGYWKKTPSAKYGRIYDIYAYLGYQFPGYLIQAYRLFEKLDEDNRLPKSIKLLDLGSGPGVVPLAALMLKQKRPEMPIEISAIERSKEHILAYNFLVNEFAKDFSDVKVNPPIEADLTSDEKIDIEEISLLTAQNVLAELQSLSIKEKADLIMRFAKKLTDDGIIVITEPAELRHATKLRELQSELIGRGLYLLGPCRYPWGSRCHNTECWTFWQTQSIRPSGLMEALSNCYDGYRYLNTDIKCSYIVLSVKPEEEKAYKIPKKTRLSRHSQLNRHIESYISVVGVKLSTDIGDSKNHIYKICDGTCKEPVFIIRPDFVSNNEFRILEDCVYGTLLQFDSVRVKWNRQKRAYNLILNEKSSIKKLPDNNTDSKMGNIISPGAN